MFLPKMWGWGGRRALDVAGWLAMAAVVLPAIARAQERDPHAAQPERPTVATHAYSVATGWLEVEFGAERDAQDGQYVGTVAPVAIKLGLASHLQLTVFTGVSQAAGTSTLDANDFGVSVKWRVADAVPGLGAIAVQPGLVVSTPPMGVSRQTGANVIVIASQSLGPVALDLNAGVTRWSGDGTDVPRTESMWAISTGGPFGGPIGWVVEVFGFPRTTGPAGADSTAALLIGPTFTVRPSLVFDAGLIAPFSGPQPRALYVGGVWNAGRVWRTRP